MTELNTVGLRAIGFNVIIKPEEVQEVSKGGIIIPEITRDTMNEYQFKGILIDKGPLAFARSQEEPPMGTMVFFNSYDGTLEEGKDKQKYRICDGSSIGAFLNSHGEIIPIWQNVLLELEPVLEKTASGIITMTMQQADRNKTSQTRGKIINKAVGTFDDIHIEDNVLFTKYEGRWLRHNNKEYRIIKDLHIGAVIE